MREDIPWRGLTTVCAVMLGALASAVAIWSLDEIQLRRTCGLQSVESVFTRAGQKPEWNRKLCEDLRKGTAMADMPDDLERDLQDALDQANNVHGRDMQVLKVIVAAGAMFWLYAFNPDIQRRRRRSVTAASSLAAVSSPSSQPVATLLGAGSSPQPAGVASAVSGFVLSRNYGALACFGFAASVCVYFSASIAGAAAASIINNKFTETIREITKSREVIRELHFTHFPADNVNPRDYDRLAWHFFFEKGGFPGESGCTESSEEKQCDVPVNMEGYDTKSFELVGDLDTADLKSRLASIIGAVAECSGDKGVNLRLATQSSSLAWCGCDDDSARKLNTKLAELRARKIREIFDEAVEAAKENDPSITQKVMLAEGVRDYRFDFSDAYFYAANPVASKNRYSPYYLSQTVALVLEDPAQCARGFTHAPNSERSMNPRRG